MKTNNRLTDGWKVMILFGFIGFWLIAIFLFWQLVSAIGFNHSGINDYGEEYRIVNGRYQYKICSLDDIPQIIYSYAQKQGLHSYPQRKYNKELCLKEGGIWDWEKIGLVYL